ncbi:MAG: ATP-binding protein [Phycisphaerales bacterium JB059]
MWAALREWFHNLSLANKCLLLFGGAATLIILIALSLPWLRMNTLVDTAERDTTREVIGAWRSLEVGEGQRRPTMLAGTYVEEMTLERVRQEAETDAFLRRAMRQFEKDASPGRERFERDWVGFSRLYRMALPVRDEQGRFAGLILGERRSSDAGVLLTVNTLYVMAAGSVVLAVALVVFAVITRRLILAPVESLRDAAERVRDGDLQTRAEIETGDEFEELADTFNLMLSALAAKQSELRAINDALDVKLTEMAEANVALFEAAKLKGDFLANVSHELRTPLNSIIGFAELLLEIAKGEHREGGEERRQTGARSLEKRIRYLENIVSAGRALLELIESLLEMAKLEAGRTELNIDQVNVVDACQGLVGLIHPQANQKGVRVRLESQGESPTIETDARKFQQVVFNLLSNAVKFTADPEGEEGRGEVVVRVERLREADDAEGSGQVRVSVIDNGPGITPEDQKRVFDKFEQLESGHTRGHSGAGLGLAIVRELVGVLQGEIQLVSEIGRGSMFSVILPERLSEETSQEEELERRFRGALSAERELDEG